jgi:hypothetical protein
MDEIKKLTLISLLLITCSCSIYNFTGTGKIDAKTYQVNFFQNNAELVEPGIDRTFTQKLQNLIQNQTNLSLTNTGGDLVYEGEIIDYRLSPMAANADQGASQTRLSITINVKFTNKKKEKDDFEKKFTFYDDFNGNEQLVGARKDEVINRIYDRITQDIFNESLAKW